MLELSGLASANSLCLARKAAKPGIEWVSIAPEPETISTSKAPRGVPVLSRAGGNLLHGWNCSWQRGCICSLLQGGLFQPWAGTLWLRRVLACANIAYLWVILSHSWRLQYNASTPTLQRHCMEVISQHRPFWTTKISQFPPVIPRLMKFFLPSLSTDRHFLFNIGFTAYPKPHLTHLNAKLPSLVTATSTTAGLWAPFLETAGGEPELLLHGDLSH